MPANFGTTPLSTTTLGANQFPVSGVFVPGTASGNLTTLQGGPSSTDGNGYTSAPVAVYSPDGNDVTLGSKADAKNSATDTTAVSIMQVLKQISFQTQNPASTPVTGTFWQSTQPVSGTVTVNAGTNLNTSALALDTSVNGLLLAQGSTTSGQKGGLILGAVTSSAPSYTTAQSSPISLTLAGALRVDGSAVTQPISAASLPLPTGAATSAKQPALGTAGSASSDVLTIQGIASMTAVKVDGSGVTQPVSGTFWQTTQPVSLASLPALAAGSANIGGVELIDSGGTNKASISAGGAVKVDGSAVTQPVSGTFWQATQPVSIAGNQAVNVAQVAGTTTSVNAGNRDAGTQRFIEAGNGTGTVTQVASAASDTSLLAANTNKKGTLFFNDSTAILYLLYGTGVASLTNYSVQIPAKAYFEDPLHYTGGFHGIWASANGFVYCTEVS